MALLVRECGAQEQYELPKNGGQLERLRRVQDLLKGYVEIAVMSDGRVVMVNEEGLSLELQDNEVASRLLGRRLVGPVLICTKEEVLAWDGMGSR